MNSKYYSTTRTLAVSLIIATMLAGTMYALPAFVVPRAYAAVPPSLAGVDTILIHQFATTTGENIAFQAGQLDIVEWPFLRRFWKDWTTCDGINDIAEECGGAARLRSFRDIGMFNIAMHSQNAPTNDLTLRKAIFLATNRNKIVNTIVGGDGIPLCGYSAPDQGGENAMLDCKGLGYPTSFGEFAGDPLTGEFTTADKQAILKVLHDGGYVDTNNNGILEKPAGSDTPAIVAILRADDPNRLDAGRDLINVLSNLPTTDSDGHLICAAPATTCGFSINKKEVPVSEAFSIVFKSPWFDWNLYTEGWGLGFNPDHLYDLLGSPFAPSQCGGGWTGANPNNYPCNVDAKYDAVSIATKLNPIPAAHDSARYGWGRVGLTAGNCEQCTKDDANIIITGGPTYPISPMFSFLGRKGFWRTDYGDPATVLAVTSTGALKTLSACTVSDACVRTRWKGIYNQEIGSGVDNFWTYKYAYLDNGVDTPTGYQTYVGQGVLDWGFRSQQQGLNIVTSSWLWSILAMQLTYDSLLGRNPADLQTKIPILAESYGESIYVCPTPAPVGISCIPGDSGTVSVYKLREGVKFNDGSLLSVDDVKFSIEYVRDNFGWNYPLVQDVVGVTTDAAARTVTVYFDNVGPLNTENVGFLWIIKQAIWQGLSSPDRFPDFDFSKQVGTGPFKMASCTPSNSCLETISLKRNTNYYGHRDWFVSKDQKVGLNADVNRDGVVNSADLSEVPALGTAGSLLDVDYRMVNVGSVTTSPIPVSVQLLGTSIDSLDQYIVKRMIFEGTATGGLLWPPLGAQYQHPDVTLNGKVDLDDLLGVFGKQRCEGIGVAENDMAGCARYDVDYNNKVGLDDLLITFVRQGKLP